MDELAGARETNRRQSGTNAGSNCGQLGAVRLDKGDGALIGLQLKDSGRRGVGGVEGVDPAIRFV